MGFGGFKKIGRSFKKAGKGITRSTKKLGKGVYKHRKKIALGAAGVAAAGLAAYGISKYAKGKERRGYAAGYGVGAADEKKRLKMAYIKKAKHARLHGRLKDAKKYLHAAKHVH